MPLIGLAVGLSLAPLAVEAQPAGKVYRPGVLWRSAASPQRQRERAQRGGGPPRPALWGRPCGGCRGGGWGGGGVAPQKRDPGQEVLLGSACFPARRPPRGRPPPRRGCVRRTADLGS